MIHYGFDTLSDIANLLRFLAKDIEHRPTSFHYGPPDPEQAAFDAAVVVLREAADKIEKATGSSA